ncbi:hypothetical protein [Pseudohalioglobus lutimaris]|uniref:Uncharacterized protein n=1 Tax=Pseudohalioglobus lutimaris TaxID=1737061 RepID=A0A2N5X0F2_9GAMM|nr:hypothetical protein [Pseudohalioglobus lutimaris]PLW67936.1 hypothetical protein C0039_14980 [Pseudohalioglobus lutimaris]
MRNSKLVICIENSDYPASLEKRKLYELLPDPVAEKIGQVRIIDESGEDYLYPSSLFVEANLPKAVQSAVIEAA